MADEHEFKLVPWYLAIYAGASMLFCIVVALLWSGFPPFLVIVVPLGSSAGLYSVMTLRLDAEGVTVAKRSAPWSDLTIRRGPFGDSLRTRADIPRSRQLGAYLPMYERQWRTRHIGACIARWAPHLLESADGPD